MLVNSRSVSACWVSSVQGRYERLASSTNKCFYAWVARSWVVGCSLLKSGQIGDFRYLIFPNFLPKPAPNPELACSSGSVVAFNHYFKPQLLNVRPLLVIHCCDDVALSVEYSNVDTTLNCGCHTRTIHSIQVLYLWLCAFVRAHVCVCVCVCVCARARVRVRARVCLCVCVLVVCRDKNVLCLFIWPLLTKRVFTHASLISAEETNGPLSHFYGVIFGRQTIPAGAPPPPPPTQCCAVAYQQDLCHWYHVQRHLFSWTCLLLWWWCFLWYFLSDQRHQVQLRQRARNKHNCNLQCCFRKTHSSSQTTISCMHRDPSMYTAYGPRGLYWNLGSPIKLTWSELDRSNFACARSAVTSLVPLERKETQPFFGTSLKKIGESVSVLELRQVFSVFWGRQGETTHGHEGSFSTFPWRFLHVVNKGIKSGMMHPST